MTTRQKATGPPGVPFFAWDDFAKRAEPELTVEQCEQAVYQIMQLEGDPGLVWILYYLQGILRQAGEVCVDPAQAVDNTIFNKGVYQGVAIAMTALMVPWQDESRGGTDFGSAAWYRELAEKKRMAADAIAATENGGQG